MPDHRPVPAGAGSGREEVRGLQVSPTGAQRASTRTWRASLAVLIATLFALGLALSVAPSVVSAASRPKVVVIVGPVGSQTSEYVADGRRLAARARAYGAAVTEL